MMLAYVPKNTIRVNRITRGDKYDKSLEIVLVNSSESIFIVEKTPQGLLVSPASPVMIPESKPVEAAAAEKEKKDVERKSGAGSVGGRGSKRNR